LAPIRSEEIALQLAEAAKDKKAENIVIMDMRRVSSVADYFLITSGHSTTQVKAITEALEKKLDEIDVGSYRKEGHNNLLWVLIDTGNVIAHIFFKDTRDFYDLERLWGDAPKKYVE
jgi:ribosome-associated protein